jgi:predicted enzyme related to lactoylglutathione lyase
MDTSNAAPRAEEIKGFDLVGLTVRSAKESIAFYRGVLGLKPSAQMEAGAEFELADGATFGIWQPQEGEWPTGFSVMFSVSDIDAAVAAMRERGAELSDPMETPVCFMSFGKDPEGNAFVVHQRK